MCPNCMGVLAIAKPVLFPGLAERELWRVEIVNDEQGGFRCGADRSKLDC
jgi:hypothetical protein